jgi:hypothetical protein
MAGSSQGAVMIGGIFHHHTRMQSSRHLGSRLAGSDSAAFQRGDYERRVLEEMTIRIAQGKLLFPTDRMSADRVEVERQLLHGRQNGTLGGTQVEHHA